MANPRHAASGVATDLTGAVVAGTAALAVGLALRKLWAGLLDEGFVLTLADAIRRGQVLYRDVYVDAPFPGVFYTLAGLFSLFGSSVEVSRVAEAVVFALATSAVFLVTRRLASGAAACAAVALFVAYRVWAFPHWHVAHYSTFSALFLLLALVVLARAPTTHRREMPGRQLERRVGSTRGGRGMPASVASLPPAGGGASATRFVTFAPHGRAAALIAEPLGGRRVFVAGCLVGGALWYKQNTGLTALLVLHAALAADALLCARRASFALLARDWVRETVRTIFWLDLGVAVVSAPIVLALGYAGALGDFYFQTVTAPLAKALDYPYLRMPPLATLGQDPVVRARIADYLPSVLITVGWEPIARSRLYRETALLDALVKLVFWLPYLVAGIAALHLVVMVARAMRREGASAQLRPWLFALTFIVAGLLAFNPPRDWTHLMMVYPWTIIVTAAVVWTLIGAIPWRFTRGIAASAAWAIVATTVASGAWLATALEATLSGVVSFPPRADVRLPPADADVLSRTLGFATAAVPEDKPLGTFPYFPWLSFVADRPILGGYAVTWPLQDSAVRDAKVIAALEREQVPAVVASVAEFAYLGLFRDNAPALYAHIVKHFRVAQIFTARDSGLLFLGLERRATPLDSAWRSAPARPGTIFLTFDGPAASSAAARESGATEELWPYAPVIAERPAAADHVERVRFEVTPPMGALLRGSVAADPAGWLSRRPSALEARIALSDSEERQVVFERRLAPASDPADRAWVEFAIDLGAHAGRQVAITLEQTCVACEGLPYERLGWSDLRIEPSG
jgi:hypothetical protein